MDKETALGDLKKQIETEADRHNHETEEVRSLRESLVSKVSSNRELLSSYGEMLGMAKALAESAMCMKALLICHPFF